MNKNEHKWDRYLKIVTVGRDDSCEDVNHYPYEPTPYTVLERMAESGYLSENCFLVDYGCGKGRVSLFLNWKLGCKTVGIEYERFFYNAAIQNKKNRGTDLVQFLWENAETYKVEKDADCFYFFNPFSVKILQSVLARIKASWYENPRSLKLFFYYPEEEYIAYLMAQDDLQFYDEIDCMDLFGGLDIRERIMIFTMGE